MILDEMISLPKIKATFHLGNKEGLAFKLFSSFAVSLFIILLLQNLAEAALVRTLLHIPKPIQAQMQKMADQAEVMVERGDKAALAEWEQAQPYQTFVLDEENREVSGREMHPHFAFKLRFARDIDTRFDNEVNKPIITMPLVSGDRLVIQFPHQQHPARIFAYYFTAIKAVIAVLILGVLSLLLARYLQAPLKKLQEASHRLAEGDFSVRVSQEVGDSVTEFRALADSFDHMTQRIEALNAKQKRLIRDVSHELKTPLARHELALHLLRRKIPDEQQVYLQRLENESNEMNTLVNEILAFSQLENTHYPPTLVPIDLHALCEQHITEMQQGLHGTQTLSLAGEPGMAREAHWVLADHTLVLRVLKNTIGNAIKYAGDNAQIVVSLVGTDIWVTDSGNGIPPQYLSSIFDPFTRVQAGREKSAGGYGLGLAIVKESMALMHGEAVAANVPEGFRITLTFQPS